MKTKLALITSVCTLALVGFFWRTPAPVPSAAKPLRGMNLPEPAAGLPPTAEVLWQKTSEVPVLAAFQAWARDFTAKPSAEKIAEGVKAATERRAEMRKLISADPEAALACAVPESVRRKMPPVVQALLEERIDALGDLRVSGLFYASGKLPAGKQAVSTQAVLEDGRSFKAFTYGRREMMPSKEDVAIHGVALDGELAVSEWPARVLEDVEVAEYSSNAPRVTNPEHTAAVTSPLVIRVGTQTQSHCCREHAAQVFFAETAEVQAYGGSDSDAQPSTLSRAPAGWTTGTKRVLVARVEFESESGHTNYHGLSDSECREIVRRLGENYKAWSCGRLDIATVGAGGSALARTVYLDKKAEDYEGDEIGDIWDEVWSELEEDYSKEDYPFLLVLAGNAPITDEESPWDAPEVVWWSGFGRIGQGLAIVRASGPSDSSEDRININLNIALHELGHNFGLRHASSLIPLPAGSPFDYAEEVYGDVYDNMGLSGRDFNARSKHWLRWMDNASLPVVTGSGVFTIREHDLDENAGVRGLQVRTDLSKEDLFIEYRMRSVTPLAETKPYVKWDFQHIAYGAMLRLARRDGPRSWLLDATPETPNTEIFSDGNYDSTLLPGRTFGMGGAYITTLEAVPGVGMITVEVQRAVPGNTAPVGSITTSSPRIGLGEKLFITANVTDAEDTDLAYHWQVPGFDDGLAQRAIFPNKRTIEVIFPAMGVYQVACIASDKHGGTVSLAKSIIVEENDAPTISFITNKTMDEDTTLDVPFAIGDPNSSPASLVVSAASSDLTLIHTQGLQITGTGANRTLSITPETNRHGSAAITVSVFDGELTTTEEFIVTVRPDTPGVTLLASGSEDWRYWAAAGPPSSGWRLTSYDDSAWAVDNARFTYPAPASNFQGWTVLPAALGRTTCYFRRSFTMPQFPAGQMVLKMICDDGAVIYINGIEVARHNMPDGRIDSSTRALTSTEGELENAAIFIPVNPAVLVPGGTNLIAVEVHDSGSVRSPGDVEFDLELALSHAPVVSGIQDRTVLEDSGAISVTFGAADFEEDIDSGIQGGPLSITVSSSNEELVNSVQISVSPGKDGKFDLTLTPEPDANGSTVITVKVSDGSSATWRSFTLNVTPVNDLPQMQPVLSRAAAVDTVLLPVKLILSDVDHDLASLGVTASSSNAALLPNAAMQILGDANPAVRWLQLAPLPGVLGESTITLTVSDGLATATRSFVLRITTAPVTTSSDVTLLPAGSAWRVNAHDLPLDAGGKPVDFTRPDFDDKNWPVLMARFAKDKNGSSGNNPYLDSNPDRITTYFRTSFHTGPPTAISQLRLKLMRDDGAVVYLNGNRVWLSNMPDLVEPRTTALSDIDRDAETQWHTLDLPPTYLVQGRNVIAVELHQSVKPATVEQRDLVFDFELTAVPTAAITQPPAGILVPAGDYWSYWDKPVDNIDAGWRAPAANDSSWSRGFAPLGYGFGSSLSTAVTRSSPANATYANKSVLYRKSFDVADPAAYTALHLFVRMDAGVAVYLNGQRLITHNVNLYASYCEPAGHPLPKAFANQTPPAGSEAIWQHYLVNPAHLVAGRNHLAVSVHQDLIAASQDKSFFDLQLMGELPQQPKVETEAAAGQFKMEWSAAYLGWQLQQSTNLRDWTPVTDAQMLGGSTLSLTVPISGNGRFYRLVQP